MEEEQVEMMEELESEEVVETESAVPTEPAEAPDEAQAVEEVAEEAPAEVSPEAKIAQDALREAEDSQAKIDQVAAAIRARKNEVIRAKDQLIEHLQAELAVRKSAEAPPAEMSPAERFIADNKGSFNPDVESLPASVVIAERRWQEKQAEQRIAEQQTKQRDQIGQASLARARRTYSDYDTIVELGSPHLSAGDKLDIATSDDPAAELYRRAIRATLNSGTEDAVMLRAALQKKLKPSVPKTTTVKEKGTQPAAASAVKTEQVETESESEEEPMSPQLAQLYNALGM